MTFEDRLLAALRSLPRLELDRFQREIDRLDHAELVEIGFALSGTATPEGERRAWAILQRHITPARGWLDHDPYSLEGALRILMADVVRRGMHDAVRREYVSDVAEFVLRLQRITKTEARA